MEPTSVVKTRPKRKAAQKPVKAAAASKRKRPSPDQSSDSEEWKGSADEKSDTDSSEKGEEEKEDDDDSKDEAVIDDKSFKKAHIKVPRPQGAPFADALSPDTLQFMAELKVNNNRDFMLHYQVNGNTTMFCLFTYERDTFILETLAPSTTGFHRLCGPGHSPATRNGPYHYGARAKGCYISTKVSHHFKGRTWVFLFL